MICSSLNIYSEDIQNYLKKISELLEVKIISVCVGHTKEETIIF
jgi:adenylosuccinate synthase